MAKFPRISGGYKIDLKRYVSVPKLSRVYFNVARPQKKDIGPMIDITDETWLNRQPRDVRAVCQKGALQC